MASSVEILESDSDTLAHRLLASSDPNTRVIELLVWFVGAVRVAYLAANIVLLVDHVVPDTLGVCVLEVSVEVDLDHTVRDGVQVLLLRATASTVEDEEDRLVILAIDLLLDIVLVLLEELRVELDVSWLVDTVDVTEAGSDGEVWGDGGQGLVDLVDVFWLGVESGVVHRLVVDTIFLTASNSNFLSDRISGASKTRLALNSPFRGTASWEQHARGTSW